MASIMQSEDGPSLAQLSEQLSAKLHEIKTAREDSVTKNEITALRADVSALNDTVENLQADLKIVTYGPVPPA